MILGPLSPNLDWIDPTHWDLERNAKKANLIEPIHGNDVEMKEGYDNPAANLE